MKVNFFSNKRDFRDQKNFFVKGYLDVLNSGNHLQSSYVKKFEDKISSICNRKYTAALGSCTDALYFALLSCGIKSKDEVLVPNFSFIASASSILRIGAKPVFVDINDDFNLSFTDAEKKISKRTKALLVVNLFGKMVDPHQINSFKKKHKLIIIEDAAQSLGASFKGIKSGSIGDVSCLSFDPTKVISAPGSAGALLTDKKKIINKVKSLRYHGKANGKFSSLGYNSQMSSITAVHLLIKLKNLKKWQTKRIKLANFYNKQLSNKLILPKYNDGSIHIYHKYVIRIKGLRDRLFKELLRKKIETRIHYNKPLNKNIVFRNSKYKNIKNSNLFSKEVLSLPIHPFVNKKQARFICDTINKFIK